MQIFIPFKCAEKTASLSTYIQNYIQGRSRALWFENPKPEFDPSPPPSRRGDVHNLTFLVPSILFSRGGK